MNQLALQDMRLGGERFAGWARTLRGVLFGLFLIQFVLVWTRLWLPGFLFGNARWPDGLLLVFTTAATLAALTRRLPGQNVMLASIIIALIGGAAHTLGASVGIPFGPFEYTNRIGQQLFEPLPWAVPLLWLVAVLTSRGVARVVLRPWRTTRNYGFWLLGATVLLVVLLDVALEPFATQVKEYWTWHPTKVKFDWYSTPWVNFVGWAITAALILAFATPALINKQPAKHPPDYQHLVIWLLLNFLFASSAATQRLWLAVGVTAGVCLVVGVFAWLGAKEGEVRSSKSEARGNTKARGA